MRKSIKPKIAIIDYGLGNLFSIKNACETVGLQGCITFSKREIMEADAVILPGVGAFGDAMKSLKQLDLITVLQEVSTSSKPLVGICLGMQLLMEESSEFGRHQGLGIIKGSVIRFDEDAGESAKHLKVPHVGWNRIYKVKRNYSKDFWINSLLNRLADGEFMYFVHSFYVKPKDQSLMLSMTQYGGTDFCSSFNYENIFACQFHPERSGSGGLTIYENLSSLLKYGSEGELNV